MNRICKKYLSEIKSLFPIMGKHERKYLSKFSVIVEEYCDEENITSIGDLYKEFGQPYIIVGTYLANIDIIRLSKRINFAKWMKRGLVAILLLALISLSMFTATIYKEHQIFKQEQIFFEEESIQ